MSDKQSVPGPVDAGTATPSPDLVVQVFDELAAAVAVAVFSGPQHVVRLVNGAVFGLTGPGRELVGQPFDEAFHELADQRIAEHPAESPSGCVSAAARAAVKRWEQRGPRG